jgi:hypothetical protein
VKPSDLKALYDNGSESFKRLNAGLPTGIAGPVADVESGVGRKVSGPAADQSQNQSRYVVLVFAHRRRQPDSDAQTAKWHVDALRQAGIIPDDNFARCRVFIVPVSVAKDQPEKIVIEVWRLE